MGNKLISFLAKSEMRRWIPLSCFFSKLQSCLILTSTTVQVFELMWVRIYFFPTMTCDTLSLSSCNPGWLMLITAITANAIANFFIYLFFCFLNIYIKKDDFFHRWWDSICLDYHRDDFRGEGLIRKLQKPKMAMLSFFKNVIL